MEARSVCRLCRTVDLSTRILVWLQNEFNRADDLNDGQQVTASGRRDSGIEAAPSGAQVGAASNVYTVQRKAKTKQDFVLLARSDACKGLCRRGLCLRTGNANPVSCPLRTSSVWQSQGEAPAGDGPLAPPWMSEEEAAQRCRGTKGDWCKAFFMQRPVPSAPPPRGDKSCLWGCNFVGVCDHMAGWCRCPAGAAAALHAGLHAGLASAREAGALASCRLHPGNAPGARNQRCAAA